MDIRQRRISWFNLRDLEIPFIQHSEDVVVCWYLFGTDPASKFDTEEVRREKLTCVYQTLRVMAAGVETMPTGIEYFLDYCINAQEFGFNVSDDPQFYLNLPVDEESGRVYIPG